MSNDERLARVANILGCDADYGMIEPTLLELLSASKRIIRNLDEGRALIGAFEQLRGILLEIQVPKAKSNIGYMGAMSRARGATPDVP